jgi:hypothetical protein
MADGMDSPLGPDGLYLYTGNTESIGHFYDDLKAKTLLSLAREDGLISTQTGPVTDDVLRSIHFKGTLRDIADWPHGNILGLAAPANIIPRYLMGVQPIEPGFAKVRIMPQPANLANASLDLPTIRGMIHVDFLSEQDRSFILNVALPANVKAVVCLPWLGSSSPDVLMDGQKRQGTLTGEFVALDDVGSGRHRFERHR